MIGLLGWCYLSFLICLKQHFLLVYQYIYICMWVRKHSATAVVNMAIWSATGYSQVKVSDYKVHFAVLASYIEGMAVKVSYI